MSARLYTAFYASALLATFMVYKIIAKFRGKVSTTRLVGPPNPSLIYGVAKDTVESDDQASIFEEWVKEYGVAFEIPYALGQRVIMLFDPKALQHYYMRETWTYMALASARISIKWTVNSSKFVSLPISHLE